MINKYLQKNAVVYILREQEQNYLSIFFVFNCVLEGRKEQKENKKRTKGVKKLAEMTFR